MKHFIFGLRIPAGLAGCSPQATFPLPQPVPPRHASPTPPPVHRQPVPQRPAAPQHHQPAPHADHGGW